MPEQPKGPAAGGDDAVQASLENSSYGGTVPAEETRSVPTQPKTALHIRRTNVGAPLIRWRWWAIALVASMGLWWALYRLLI